MGSVPAHKTRNTKCPLYVGEVEVFSREEKAVCPISLTAVDTPAKGSDCTHSRCFDLKVRPFSLCEVG